MFSIKIKPLMIYALKYNFLYFAISIANNLLAQDADELSSIRPYLEQCLDNKSRFDNQFKTECYTNYSLYHPPKKVAYDDSLAARNGNIKIAHFNLLHPGMSKTKFKDFRILANIINQWDLLAATELIPLLNDDLIHNKKISDFIKETAPREIEKYQEMITTGKKKKKPIEENIALYEKIIARLKEDQMKAAKLFRKPGYLQILEELHKLPNGKDWSLILSSRGDAAKETDVQEMVGYFFKSSLVKPVKNDFCNLIEIEGKDRESFACIAPMTPQWMHHEKNFREHFSRRPFMATFASNQFTFTMLAAHIVFTSKKDSTEIAQLFFNNEKIDGINKQNHDRVAEVKATLDFMQILKNNYSMKNLIYTGDLNLESNEKFWSRILPTFTGAEVFITEPTSVSENKYIDNTKPTNGVASNYDHFIFNPTELDNCVTADNSINGGVFSFYQQSGIMPDLMNPYLIRTKNGFDQKKKDKLLTVFISQLKSDSKLSVTNTIGLFSANKSIKIPAIIEDIKVIDEYKADFKSRVLESQLIDKTYYKVYSQLISDHKPVFMECSNN